MEDGRIPKDVLYGELATGRRNVGRPQLCFRDVCKRDMKALEINTECWEDLATDRSKWRGTLTRLLKAGEERLTAVAGEKKGPTGRTATDPAAWRPLTSATYVTRTAIRASACSATGGAVPAE